MRNKDEGSWAYTVKKSEVGPCRLPDLAKLDF